MVSNFVFLLLPSFLPSPSLLSSSLARPLIKYLHLARSWHQPPLHLMHGVLGLLLSYGQKFPKYAEFPEFCNSRHILLMNYSVNSLG